MNLTSAPITAVGKALQPPGPAPMRMSAASVRPYIGILGVLLGSIMSVLGTRVTGLGIADLRGALHFGFDEGAWMTTSFGIGQMMIGVCCPYLGGILGIRRVLLGGIVVFFAASALAPLSPNLSAFMAMQFLAGIGSGTFIPLTVGFIARNLPSRLIVYGLAVYAMNSELSQNVAASLEGWYSDNLTWQWINWQYCLALPLMFICVLIGIPREEVKTDLVARLDWPGLAYAGIGFSLLYAGLDQGNRLDWTNNGLVNGLLVSGAVLTSVFVVRELFVAQAPFINLRLLLQHHLVLLLLLLAGYRFIILSTSYIIPSYLQAVQDFRELQVGAVLLWIALPQFAIVLPLGFLLARADARWVLAAGATLVGIACLMAAQLTSVWATDDFLPSQLLQALGQSFALTALVVLIVQSINPADVLTIGALLQISRLFGGEIGTAFMQTFVRQRTQIHSNLIGQHIDGLSVLTADRLTLLRAAVSAHTSDVAIASAQATRLLASAVARQAAVLAYIDGFVAAAVGAAICLVATALLPRFRFPSSPP
ncbi:MFS transporter [Mesorhizobium kowhaii]|uniref:MFS transporter n=1 Tax=Mesorhizobium kowhaii TaxID=1300272 RepID=A0A2W7CTU0_9HYPH|nr:MFS transporter [Mesorhizobium kowhaii]PZV40103.1 MFS transporter [Mesorhizobium kowhaii]